VCGQGENLLKRGDSFLQKPLYDSAYVAYQVALREYRIRNNTQGMIECLNRLATIDNIFTRTNSAIQLLRECLELLYRSPALKKQLAVCEEQLGRAYEDLGDIEESGKHTQKALRLRLEIFGENDARTAYAYMNLARYHSFRTANDSSFFYSQRAYSICKNHPEHLKEIRFPELLLQYAYDSKNKEVVPDELRETHFRRIRNLYHQALEETRRRYSMPSAEEAAAYQGLANTYNDQVGFNFKISQAQGQACFDSASMFYDRSLAIKRKLYGEYHRSVSVSYYTKALIYGTHPDLSMKLQAFDIYQQAMRAVVPGYNPSGPFSLPEGLKSSHPYQLSVVLKECYLLLRKIHRTTQSVEYLRYAHAFASHRLEAWDEIVSRFVSRQSGSTIWIWGRTPFEDAVTTAYDMFKTTGDSSFLEEMFSYAERGRNNDFAEQALRSAGKNDGMVLDADISKHTTTNVTRKRFVEDVLDEKTAYLCFIPNKESDTGRDFMLVMTKNRYEVKELWAPVIDSLVRKLEGAIQNMQANDFCVAAGGLYEKTLAPVLEALPNHIDKLILSVDGPYSKIPFEALLTENKPESTNDFRYLPYLLRQYSIHYALSASHLTAVSSGNIPATAGLGVFVPSFSTNSSLLFSERSAESLSSTYKGDFYIGASATRNAFLSSTNRYSIIQLSTHAEADLDDPGKSVLLFSGKQQEDSLFLNEVLGLKLNNPLTIISACETGKGKSVYGEGSKSLARAFAFAGSQSVLSTLWRVDDKATSAIIEAFYKQASAGTEKPNALRKAKLYYLNSCKTSEAANPFFWSGLVLSGDPRPLNIEKQSPFARALPYIKVGGVVFILLALGWRRWKNDSRRAA
jgi:CHAT domain-containing protein